MRSKRKTKVVYKMRRSFSMKKMKIFVQERPLLNLCLPFQYEFSINGNFCLYVKVCRLSFLQMLFSVLRPTLNIFPRRFLSSQTSILPYEIDRFNAARVRVKDWPENTETTRDILSS